MSRIRGWKAYLFSYDTNNLDFTLNCLQILSYDIHHLILQFFFLFTIFFVVCQIVPFIGIVLMVVEFFFSITIQDVSPVPLFS